MKPQDRAAPSCAKRRTFELSVSTGLRQGTSTRRPPRRVQIVYPNPASHLPQEFFARLLEAPVRHFNPAVTLADASQGGILWREVPSYIAAQVAGALLGVGAAHLMFGEALLQVSQHSRAGGSQLFSEFVATFGLLGVIWGCSRLRADAVPFAVGRGRLRGDLPVPLAGSLAPETSAGCRRASCEGSPAWQIRNGC